MELNKTELRILAHTIMKYGGWTNDMWNDEQVDAEFHHDHNTIYYYDGFTYEWSSDENIWLMQEWNPTYIICQAMDLLNKLPDVNRNEFIIKGIFVDHDNFCEEVCKSAVKYFRKILLLDKE